MRNDQNMQNRIDAIGTDKIRLPATMMTTIRGKGLVGLAMGLLALCAPAQPVITTPPVSQTVVAGSNALFNVQVAGVGPFTYQWQFNGTNLPNNLITTVAGNGTSSFSGDGGLATNASLYWPYSVAADASGNFLMADSQNNRIRRVDLNGMMTTVAGTGSSSFAGDGGAANLAKIYSPSGVALDAGGNYYIADTGNNRIRKVDTNGLITTVAGNGTASYGGDGAAATNASLYSPRAVAVDNLGNLYIADTSNNRIRKVDSTGLITTLAGTNSSGFAGDGGLATSAILNQPWGVAVDGVGNIFIGDYGNNRIRRIDTSGVITTIAGTNGSGFLGDGGAATKAQLFSPRGVAVDNYGYILIADAANNRIRQVDPAGIITTVAGNGLTSFSGDGGVPTNASLAAPYGVAWESAGSLLIADNSHSRIRRVTLGRVPGLPLNSVTTNNAGNYQVIVTSPAGSVTSSVVALTVVSVPSIVTQPQSLIASNGTAANVSVTASGTGPLGYQWYQNNVPVTGGTNAGLTLPAVSAAQAGNYYCIVTNNYGTAMSSQVTLTVLVPPSIITQPTNQALVSGNNTTFSVAVAGTGPFTYQWQLNGTNLPNQNNIITRVAGVSTQSGFGGDGGWATNATLSSVSGVRLDFAGNVIIADQRNNRVRRVDTNGILTTIAGIGPNGSSGSFAGDGGAATNANLNMFAVNTPSGVALDATGNLYIADTSNNRIRRVDTNGIISTIAGTNSSGYSGDGGLAVVAKLSAPAGVAVDAAGNVFFADAGNNRIRKVGLNGIISTVAGTNVAGYFGDLGPATNAKLSSPYGIALDTNGNLFIADKGNQRIRKVDSNGIISTLAGTGTAGYGGDNSFATNALLNQPYGVAVGPYGEILIADYGNNRVRLVTVDGMISTVAGTGASGYSGDGGSATNAALNNPTSIGTDQYGNVYVGGSLYSTVRKINLGRSPLLTLPNLGPTNVGSYDVMVTSPYGSVTSSNALLVLVYPPSITRPPAFTRVQLGASATFSVTATNNPPFGYQWFTSSGRPAMANPIISAGAVFMIAVWDGGMGYVATPQVHFIGGSGSGASGTASVFGNQVISVSVRTPGSGYASAAPTIQIDPPPMVFTPLPNQTNATLNLPATTGSDATNYFVVITNNYGSITSSIVALLVFVPPQNFAAQTSSNGIQLQLTGTPGFPYVVQSATNLISPVIWQSISTNYSDTNGWWQFTDTNLTGGQKYYRALGQ